MTSSDSSKGTASEVIQTRDTFLLSFFRTGFKASLLRYLRYYEVSDVHQFITAVEAADMSGVNVAFVSSVPGSHKDGAMCLWGHRSVAKLLRSHVPTHVATWPVVAQCSSIGSLGQTPDTWLESELGASLASVRPGPGGPLARATCRPHVSLIYPSHGDVLASYDGLLGGGCLPYSRATAVKQPWLQVLFEMRLCHCHIVISCVRIIFTTGEQTPAPGLEPRLTSRPTPGRTPRTPPSPSSSSPPPTCPRRPGGASTRTGRAASS